MATNEKLSLLAGRAVPRFVKEEYPQFLNFIKAYFEYLERDGGEYDVVANMTNIMDIDKSVDAFLFDFKQTYMRDFPDTLAVDIRFIIKKIKDFYTAKGTEKSFEFLFRTIFDTPVEFYYPKTDILRASSGSWIQPYYIIPEKLAGQSTNPDLFALVDQKIQGLQSGATAYIDERKLLTIDFPELIPNASFTLPDNPWKTYGVATTEHFPATSILKLIRNDASVNNASGMTAEISVSDSTYCDLKFDIEKFENHSNTAKLEVYVDTVKVGEITRSGLHSFEKVKVNKDAKSTIKIEMVGDLTWSVNFKSISLKNNAAVLLVYGSSLVEIVGEFIAGEECKVISPRVDSNTGKPLPAIPNFRIKKEIRKQSAIIRPKGRYADTNGHLSSGKKLQDSNYYQDFSYELISEIPVRFYDEVVKRLVHPAGFKMFGKVEKKSIDVISLRDLITNFEMIISWIETNSASVEKFYDATPYVIKSDTERAYSERHDWNHFFAEKEQSQYEGFKIGQLDNFSMIDLRDLESDNFQMVFVNNRKIPSNEYSIHDRVVNMNVAPPTSTIVRPAAKFNVETVELSHSLQDPTFFKTDGMNVRYQLADDLLIDDSRKVLVFLDGLILSSETDYAVESRFVGSVKKSDIVFTKVHAKDLKVDVIVLDGNSIAGNSYAPKTLYKGLKESDISFSKPVPIHNMPDSADEKSLMIFVNGRKIQHHLYAIYYDLQRKQYMLRPSFNPTLLGIPAPYDIHIIYLKADIMASDLFKGNGTEKNFTMKANLNHFLLNDMAIKKEHQYIDVHQGSREYTFSRLSDMDTTDFIRPLWDHGLLVSNMKVKIYFEVEITALNTHFNNHKIGVSSNGWAVVPDSEKYLTITKNGKYVYNKTFTVSDTPNNKTQLLVGQLAGKISNLTLSVIDD